jgi:hypothetical protein
MAKESVKSIISKNADERVKQNAANILKNAKPADVEKIILSTKLFSNPFKDIKFLNKVKSEGDKMGISKEALTIIKSAKSAKDALEKANKAGVVEEIKEAYGRILNLTKSNKGFINPTAMAEDMGLKAKDSTKALMEEAKKYGSVEEFVKAQ